MSRIKQLFMTYYMIKRNVELKNLAFKNTQVELMITSLNRLGKIVKKLSTIIMIKNA